MEFLKFNGLELEPINLEYSTDDKERTELRAVQEAVGGMIELLPFMYFPELEGAGIDCWINEEGKLLARDGDTIAPTVVFRNADKPNDIRNLVDIIFGPVVFTRHDEDGGFASLEEGDEKLISEALSIKHIQFLGWGDQVRPVASVFLPIRTPGEK